ncbi:DUF6270 domain-containing protein [Corynebacterium mayonis]|uniref:DUF6270 domain-containing protein n=1 Tax=Corynebacterium mayonis TaxID=3062461 RepID=UPI003140B6E2
MHDVTVFGSCISRDVFSQPLEHLRLRAYFARSSWISATSAPVPRPKQPSSLESSFQQRMLENDFRSSVLPQLDRLEPQILLLDLVDERSGVLRTIDGGYITDLSELKHSGWRDQLRGPRKVPFGSDEHFDLFRAATPAVFRAAKKHKIVVLQSLFATRDLEGERLADLNGREITEWNNLYSPYFTFLDDFGANILKVPEELCVADSNHRWGTAPYHYIPEFYEWVAKELERSGGDEDSRR